MSNLGKSGEYLLCPPFLISLCKSLGFATPPNAIIRVEHPAWVAALRSVSRLVMSVAARYDVATHRLHHPTGRYCIVLH